jgi:hypothetical protein
LTVSVTGTSPGPNTADPVCAPASGTATDVIALAMLVTPALFKKSLRLTDIGGIIPGLGAPGQPIARLNLALRHRAIRSASLSGERRRNRYAGST